VPFADLVQDDGFRTGLAIGATALLLIVLGRVVAVWAGWRRGEPLPLAGIALPAAGLLALQDLDLGAGISDRLVVGIVFLVLGPLLARLGGFGSSLPVVALATVPGAAVLASAASLENDVGWVPPVVFVAVVVGGTLATDFDRVNARAGLGPVLMAVSVLAMYTAVPDTEEAAAVAGASLPLALSGAPIPVASLGAAGAPASVGLLVWVAAVGGRARPGSVVGAAACLGVLLVEPIVRRVRANRRPTSPSRPVSVRAVLLVVLDLGLVAVTSRVAGLETSGAVSLSISLVALAAAGVVVTVILSPWTARAEEPSASRRRTPGRARRRPATRPTPR
jgi:hypothetical protein